MHALTHPKRGKSNQLGHAGSQEGSRQLSGPPPPLSVGLQWLTLSLLNHSRLQLSSVPSQQQKDGLTHRLTGIWVTGVSTILGEPRPFFLSFFFFSPSFSLPIFLSCSFFTFIPVLMPFFPKSSSFPLPFSQISCILRSPSSPSSSATLFFSLSLNLPVAHLTCSQAFEFLLSHLHLIPLSYWTTSLPSSLSSFSHPQTISSALPPSPTHYYTLSSVFCQGCALSIPGDREGKAPSLYGTGLNVISI